MYKYSIVTLIMTQFLVASTAYSSEVHHTVDLGGSCSVEPNTICPDNVEVTSSLANISRTDVATQKVVIQFNSQAQAAAAKLTPTLKIDTTLSTGLVSGLTKTQTQTQTQTISDALAQFKPTPSLSGLGDTSKRPKQ